MSSGYKTIPTSPEVWLAIRKEHPEMVVYSSFSHEGRMFTSYGFKSGNFPVIEAETTWDIDPENRCNRVDERHKYWLCLPEKADD